MLSLSLFFLCSISASILPPLTPCISRARKMTDWLHLYIAGIAFLVFGLVSLVLLFHSQQGKADDNESIFTYLIFAWANFFKPHDKKGEGQQDALESFYKSQATVYDATRRRLLHGREDMLGLVAAQLKHRMENKVFKEGKAIWIDVSFFLFFLFFISHQPGNADECLGRRWHWVSSKRRRVENENPNMRRRYNIEAMAEFLPVDKFFEHVYLVDLSPSLCDIARQRFERLGWKNVTVICQDARSFRLPLRQLDQQSKSGVTSDCADLITLSYSLSMIPGETCPCSAREFLADMTTRLLQRRGLVHLASQADRCFGRL